MAALWALALLGTAHAWQDWLSNFGHDSFRYPAWISEQQRQCRCSVDLLPGEERRVECRAGAETVDWRSSTELTWCSSRHFLLSHMPSFDLHFLPGSVSVAGTSMLDDNIAFALMAWNASSLQPRPPPKLAFAYLLPYATYHESRSNWRPLFFAKFFKLAAGLSSSREVVKALIGNNLQLMNWTHFTWPGYSGQTPSNDYYLGPFASGSTPPVVSPTDFIAYGYGSCTGWAKFLSSALKAVGVPAREVGSPCWNTVEFAGLATENPNVSICWQGGLPGAAGGKYLNNHNWVEYWDNLAASWRFLDVATSSSEENTWFCGEFSNGCTCASNAGKAMRDHDILAPTWSVAGEAVELEGGPVIDVSKLTLSTGEAVSPMVWSPKLTSPIGADLKDIGLRMVNRTSFYRCKSEQVQHDSGPSRADQPDETVSAGHSTQEDGVDSVQARLARMSRQEKLDLLAQWQARFAIYQNLPSDAQQRHIQQMANNPDPDVALAFAILHETASTPGA